MSKITTILEEAVQYGTGEKLKAYVHPGPQLTCNTSATQPTGAESSETLGLVRPGNSTIKKGENLLNKKLYIVKFVFLVWQLFHNVDCMFKVEDK